MKIKKGFILRKTGKDCMVVAVGAASKEFNGMIRMNAAGEFLWNQMKKEISEEELVQKMLERYENLDEQTARTDLKEFLDTIKIALED